MLLNMLRNHPQKAQTTPILQAENQFSAPTPATCLTVTKEQESNSKPSQETSQESPDYCSKAQPRLLHYSVARLKTIFELLMKLVTGHCTHVLVTASGPGWVLELLSFLTLAAPSQAWDGLPGWRFPLENPALNIPYQSLGRCGTALGI